MPDIEASRRMRDPKVLPRHWMMMAASGVVYDDGKLLVVRDPHGFWAGVGGWIDPGESPEAAIVREVREELGVGCDVIRPLRPFIAWNVVPEETPAVSFLLFPHRIRLHSTDFTVDQLELTDVTWVTPTALFDLDMLPHVRSLFVDRLEEWTTPQLA
ncbi:MAG: NUDIX hydrolase [Chloroflexota bacterium]